MFQIMAMDKVRKDRVLKVLREEVSSVEEMPFAMTLVKSGATIDEMVEFLQDSSPTAKMRQGIKEAAEKVGNAGKAVLAKAEAGLAAVKKLDADLKPQVDAIRKRVERNREVKASWWQRNRADVLTGVATIIGILAAVVFLR